MICRFMRRLLLVTMPGIIVVAKSPSLGEVF
jgi:hypothetical protein